MRWRPALLVVTRHCAETAEHRRLVVLACGCFVTRLQQLRTRNDEEGRSSIMTILLLGLLVLAEARESRGA